MTEEAPTTPDKPSPQYTITMGAGTADVLKACVARVQDAASDAEANPKDYEDLARKRQEVIEEMWSLVRTLSSVITSTPHDGDVQVYPYPEHDELALFWRYASGYHGGLIHYKRRWSIHT